MVAYHGQYETQQGSISLSTTDARIVFSLLGSRPVGHSQLMVHESRKEVGAEVKCNRGLATHNIADSSLLNTLVLL